METDQMTVINNSVSSQPSKIEAVFTYTAHVSDVVKPEAPMPPDQDQTFVCTLFSNGTLSLKFRGQQGNLISRISIPLKGASAFETFCEPGKDYWLFRINGNQVPLVLPATECIKLMDEVDALTA